MAVQKTSKAKVIRSTDGIERVAQACDRCRSKKTKCDGKRPQCSQCAAVGFECKISDRLSRRAFPRGYTESLEERVRELEAENRKLLALIDLKDEQLELYSKHAHGDLLGSGSSQLLSDGSDTKNNGSPSQKASSQDGLSPGNHDAQSLAGSASNSSAAAAEKSIFELSAANKLNSSNLSLLNQLNGPKIHTHEPHADGCNCGCVNYPHSVHERPTSIAASAVLDNTDVVEDDDNASILSFDNSQSNTVINNDSGSLKQSYNFFDDNRRQFDNLRNNPHANNLSSNGNSNSSSYFNSFNVSFEQKEAPGAAAAMAIASVNDDKTHVKNRIAALVAMSTPRTTEEILFIPSLIGKVGNVHGFNSKPAVLTAKTLALLKFPYAPKKDSASNEENAISLKNINFNKISKAESHLFFTSLRLPSRLDLDQLITFYFQEWAAVTPVVDQQEFLKSYMKLNKSAENKFNDNDMFTNEKFGVIVLLVVTLALLGKKKGNKYKIDIATATNSGNSPNGNNDNGAKSIKFINSGLKSSTLNDAEPWATTTTTTTNSSASSIKNENSPEHSELVQNDPDVATTKLLNYYDNIIKQLISSSIVDLCSMQSLQILTLALIYSLNVGDVESSYILRGKVVSMAQQLRLHRCPSAVLSNSGSIVSKVQQSERRILFWCVYTLDVFSSLQLGVPRLVKDYEIECALPFANDDLDDSNNTNILIINNAKLSLVGKVSNFSLAVMRFSKILGNILDSIFRRGGVTIDALGKSCIILENLLENWRKDLPNNLRFELDVNGLLKNNEYKSYNHKILIMITLYYQAKMLIYLPVLAAELHSSRGSSSYITIHQSSNTILAITNYISHLNYFLPTPINPSRMRARYGLLGAKGALEYARGGNLFQDLKNTLFELISDLKVETNIKVPGCLSSDCIKTFEDTIQAILSPPRSNNGLLQNNQKSVGRRRSASLKQGTSLSPSIGSNLKNSIIASPNFGQNQNSHKFVKIEPNLTGNSTKSGHGGVLIEQQNSTSSPLVSSFKGNNLFNFNSSQSSVPKQGSQQPQQILPQLGHQPPSQQDFLQNIQQSAPFNNMPASAPSSTVSAQPMGHSASNSSTNVSFNNSSSNVNSNNNNRNSPQDAGFDVDENMFSEFAADGSLGLAQLLDIDMNFSDPEKLNNLLNGNLGIITNGGYNFNPDASASSAPSVNGDIGNNTNAGNNTNYQNSFFPDNINQFNGTVPGNGNTRKTNALIDNNNNNDNNPISSDSFMKFENSFFGWQNRK